jgi:hypothetical protein
MMTGADPRGRPFYPGLPAMNADPRARGPEVMVMLVVTIGLAALGVNSRLRPPRRPPAPPAGPGVSAAAAKPPGKPQERIVALPRLVGERLEFEFGWQAPGDAARVVAASGKAEVVEETVGGRKRLVLRGKASTKGAVEMLWKMRDRVEAIVDAETLLVQQYTIEQKEGRQHTLTNIVFAEDGRGARMTRTRFHKPANDPRRTIEETRPCAGRLDPASLAYYLRGMDAAPGADRATAPVFDGEHSFWIFVTPLKRERLRVAAGEFDAFRCQVSFAAIDRQPKPGEKPKVRKAILWVTAGPEHVPLKLESETFVGSVYGELVGYTPPAAAKQ